MSVQRGFTLVELLVVIAIIAIMAVFVVPAADQLLRGSHLTQAGELVQGQLSLARQTAVARNSNVEVRFYRYGDPGMPGEDAGDPAGGKFRALQVFQIDAAGEAVPIGKVQTLPDPVVFDSGGPLSSILDSSKRTLLSGTDIRIPTAGTSYQYFSIVFRPDGSTDLPPTVTAGGSSTGQLWFVTLHNATDGDGLAEPPANYWTIQIDPVNGSLTSYRP